MDLLALLRLTVRRWFVVVPTLIVTFLAVVLLVVQRGSEYSMEGSHLLVAANVIDPVETSLDPMLVVDVLDDLLLTRHVRAELEAQGLPTTFTVAIGETGTSLRLTVTGTGTETDPQAMVGAANVLIRLVPDLLLETFQGSANTISAKAVTAPSLADVTEEGGTYTIGTTIVVSAVDANSGNPFQANPATVAVLIRTTRSTAFLTDIAEIAPSAVYSVTSTVRDAPVLDITVNASSAGEAVVAYEAVQDKVRSELARLQDEASVDLRYRTVTRGIVEPFAPTETPASIARPAAGVVLLGSGLAVALATLVESVSVAARRAKETGSRVPAWKTRLGRRVRPLATLVESVSVAARRAKQTGSRVPAWKTRLGRRIRPHSVTADEAVADSADVEDVAAGEGVASDEIVIDVDDAAGAEPPKSISEPPKSISEPPESVSEPPESVSEPPEPSDVGVAEVVLGPPERRNGDRRASHTDPANDGTRQPETFRRAPARSRQPARKRR